MNIDELMNYIETDDNSKKKNRKKKKQTKMSTEENETYESNDLYEKESRDSLELQIRIPISKNSSKSAGFTSKYEGKTKDEIDKAMAEEYLENIVNKTTRYLKETLIFDNEFEEFKTKIMNDSVKCGQFSKIKPRFSDNWIKELIL